MRSSQLRSLALVLVSLAGVWFGACDKKGYVSVTYRHVMSFERYSTGGGVKSVHPDMFSVFEVDGLENTTQSLFVFSPQKLRAAVAALEGGSYVAGPADFEGGAAFHIFKDSPWAKDPQLSSSQLVVAQSSKFAVSPKYRIIVRIKGYDVSSTDDEEAGINLLYPRSGTDPPVLMTRDYDGEPKRKYEHLLFTGGL